MSIGTHARNPYDDYETACGKLLRGCGRIADVILPVSCPDCLEKLAQWEEDDRPVPIPDPQLNLFCNE